MDKTTEMLLVDAKEEIKSLRNQNQSMGLRLDMFDKMMMLFFTAPNFPGQGMSEDVCWKIEKHIEAEKMQSKQS